MRIVINRNIDTPIYMQIKSQIRDMIYKRTLLPGFLLLPERKLAETLGVNRSTVLKAYQELKADGLIGSHVGKGTQVLEQAVINNPFEDKKIYPVFWNQFFNTNTFSVNERIINDIMEISSDEDIISFAAGVPSPELYPVKEIEEIQTKLLKTSGREMLLHSAGEGYHPLRESICKLLKQRDIQIASKEVMILSGSQQGLDLASRIFLSPGDTVFVEETTYLGAIQLFGSSGARVIGVPMDDKGMNIDILKSLLTRYKPKFIYTLPTFQNPSGVVMSLERRYQLLELTYRYQVPILEDDPYGELRYESNFIPPLKAIDKYGYVMYLSTFSKTMFLGLRIGWLAAPEQVINKFTYMKQMIDIHSNTPAQWMFDQFLRQGFYEEHLERICKEYSHKRDVMLKCLEENKVPGMSWNTPEGGYYIWLKLPEGVNQSKLLTKAAQKGVAFVPGEAFYPDGNQTGNFIRLNFSFPTLEQIKEGIKRLISAVNVTLKESKDIEKDTGYYKKPII